MSKPNLQPSSSPPPASVVSYRAPPTSAADTAHWYREASGAFETGDWARSIRRLRQGLVFAPASLGMAALLALALHRNRQYDASKTAILRAIAIRPDREQSWRLLATLDHGGRRTVPALRATRRGLILAPVDPAGVLNLFHIHRQAHEDDAADRWATRGLVLRPDYDDLAFTLAMLRLGRRDWAGGWPLYDRRLRLERSKPDPDRYPWPRWDGRTDPKCRLLVWCDQHVGDEMQFAQILPQVAARVGRLTVECDPRLVGMFRRGFPEAIVLPRGESPPEGPFDAQIPSGHLGGLFRGKPADFAAAPTRWLAADPDLAADRRALYQRIAKGRPVIGLSWKSSNKIFQAKNIPLADWGPVLQGRDALFISLQYGEVAADINAARQRLGVEVGFDRTMDPLTDLDRFAAQLEAVDLVLSTSNSTVHQACALGRPVWSLVHARPDWRWGLEGERNPWFPTLRIYRATSEGGWPPVLDRVGQDLDRWLAARR